MKGQASIENVMLIMLILTISTVVVGRWLSLDDKTFIIGSAREAVIFEIQKSDSKYIMRKIDAEIIKCTDLTENVLVNVGIQPEPQNPFDTTLQSAIQTNIADMTGRPSAKTQVFFNQPTQLFSTTC